MAGAIILWRRRELRLADNPARTAALARAAQTGQPVVPVFVLDDESAGPWAPGGASRWWLHHSLAALGETLAALGAPLVLRRGRYAEAIPALAAETGATEIHVGRPIEPWARGAIRPLARLPGLRLVVHDTSLLRAPGTVRTRAGTPFLVFSPYARACLDQPPPPYPAAAPAHIPGRVGIASDPLGAWALRPTAPDWAGGLRDAWTPGEAGARAALARFLGTALERYGTDRDRPDLPATSRLSPHLAFGEISPATIWHEAEHRGGAGLARFRNEVLWREFAAELLWHNPDLPHTPLRPAFAAMPWRDDPAGLEAWRRGRTGVPIIDAGMRELWQTGWMHNRVRMIVASFLAKHLLIPWQQGEAWFWETLVDADLATNAASWQWVAGSGADAAPYIRVFNPVLQGRKFDPNGAYVRRFVPELARLEADAIHAPWESSATTLRQGGVVLGRSYPRPIVDLAAGRARALAAFAGVAAHRGDAA